MEAFYTLQGEAAGAQAFSSFDTLLAPFIYYDKLDYEEVKQALQEFVFNINVPTRVGFQTPFTNITMDLEAPDIYKDQPVIIGGKSLRIRVMKQPIIIATMPPTTIAPAMLARPPGCSAIACMLGT